MYEKFSYKQLLSVEIKIEMTGFEPANLLDPNQAPSPD